MDLKSLEESLDKEFELTNESAINKLSVNKKIKGIAKNAEKKNAEKIVIKKIDNVDDLRKLKKERRLKKLAAIIGLNIAGVGSVIANKGQVSNVTKSLSILQDLIIFDSIFRRVLPGSPGNEGVTVGVYGKDDRLIKIYIINTDIKADEMKSLMKSGLNKDIVLEDTNIDKENALSITKEVYDVLKESIKGESTNMNKNEELNGLNEELDLLVEAKEITDSQKESAKESDSVTATKFKEKSSKAKAKVIEKGGKVLPDSATVSAGAGQTTGMARLKFKYKYKGKVKTGSVPIKFFLTRPGAYMWVRKNSEKYVKIFESAPSRVNEGLNEELTSLEETLDKEFGL